jgi:hypothetical protein
MAVPNHLIPDTQKWFQQVAQDYELQDHHLRLLTLAGEAWDRCNEAREILKRDGMTYLDRFNQPRARPEVSIERDSRIAFARLLRELNLEGDESPDIPRSSGLKY